MAITVRAITNSRVMAMVAKIVSLMMTTILKYWPRTKNTCKPTRTNCQQALHCNRGMYVWPSTVGPRHNERRGQGLAAPKLCKRPRGSGLGDRSLQVSVGACSWSTMVRAIRVEKRTRSASWPSVKTQNAKKESSLSRGYQAIRTFSSFRKARTALWEGSRP